MRRPKPIECPTCGLMMECVEQSGSLTTYDCRACATEGGRAWAWKESIPTTSIGEIAYLRSTRTVAEVLVDTFQADVQGGMVRIRIDLGNVKLVKAWVKAWAIKLVEAELDHSGDVTAPEVVPVYIVDGWLHIERSPVKTFVGSLAPRKPWTPDTDFKAGDMMEDQHHGLSVCIVAGVGSSAVFATLEGSVYARLNAVTP